MPTLREGEVRVDHVWKRFRSDRARPELHEQLVGLGRRLLRRNPDPWRWVLRDVNLHVGPGETVALVGLNGSGKSTLLKIVSRVTCQTAGYSEVSGRIGALLEVRSGIHPDLTGRENIFLYGSILGLGRKQIARRFDEIVEFAEVADAIDRQIKFYSSGMQIRLGFAIAAFLEPALLVVDEVLAVGDATFQQKCLQRISDVVAGGSTLLFVSHDLAAVEAMCDRALWLSDSVVRAEGPTRDVLGLYRSAVEERAVLTTADNRGATVVKAEVTGSEGGQVLTGGPLDVHLVAQLAEGGHGDLFIGISEGTATPVFVSRKALTFGEGDLEIRATLKNLPLARGRYSLWASLTVGGPHDKASRTYLPWQPVQSFNVFGPLAPGIPRGVMVLSPIHVDTDWQVDAPT